MARMTHQVWAALAALLAVSVVAAGISLALSAFYDVVKGVIPVMMVVVSLSGIGIGCLVVRNHAAKQRKEELTVVIADYLVVGSALFLHPTGTQGWLALLAVMVLAVVVNHHVAADMASLKFLHANTLFSMPMAATFYGLFYANNVSSDWGTLYLTGATGVAFATLGVVFVTISLVSR